MKRVDEESCADKNGGFKAGIYPLSWVRGRADCRGSLGLFSAFLLAPSRFLGRAAIALYRGEFEEAEHLANLALEHLPECPSGLLIAGEAAGKLHRSEDALGYFRRVTTDAKAEYVQAQCGAAKRFIQLGRAADAERCLRQALQVDANHPESNQRLAVVLQIEGAPSRPCRMRLP